MPFFIFSNQLALFFSKRARPGLDISLKLTKTPFGERFNETIDINKFPDDPQFDNVPSVNLRTADKTARLTLSRTRADLFLDAGWNATFEDSKSSFHAMFEEFSKTIIEILTFDDIVINHIGFLNNFFSADKDASRKIGKFLKVDPQDLQGGTINNCGLRIETVDQINKYKVNNVTRLDKANAAHVVTGNKAEGILLVRDFNTLPSGNANQFNWDEISSFILKAEEKLNITKFESQLADA